MKNLSLLMVLFLSLMSSCDRQEKSREEQVCDCAEGFALAYFNHDYRQAEHFVTPESSRWLRFAASNISEADVEQLNAHGLAATVETTDYRQADDTTAVVTVAVAGYLHFDTIGGRGTVADDGSEYCLTLVNRAGYWLVRMAGLPRSERHSRD